MSRQLGSRLHRDEKIDYLDQLPNLAPKDRKNAERLNAEQPDMPMQRFKVAVAAIRRPAQPPEVIAARSQQFLDQRAPGDSLGARRQDMLALSTEQLEHPVEGELIRTTGLGADPHYFHLALAERREAK
jgi:hypothetical protein